MDLLPRTIDAAGCPGDLVCVAGFGGTGILAGDTLGKVSRPMMTPVIGSPMAMENLPSVVEHTIGPPTFCDWPSTVTFADPGATEAVLDEVAELEFVAALDDVALGDVVLDDGPDALLPLEQPATPATMVGFDPR